MMISQLDVHVIIHVPSILSQVRHSLRDIQSQSKRSLIIIGALVSCSGQGKKIQNMYHVKIFSSTMFSNSTVLIYFNILSSIVHRVHYYNYNHVHYNNSNAHRNTSNAHNKNNHGHNNNDQIQNGNTHSKTTIMSTTTTIMPKSTTIHTTKTTTSVLTSTKLTTTESTPTTQLPCQL